MAVIDQRELRNAFGTFLTGVTIVTTIDTDGRPRGFTANSFTSVSMDPPLLLVCLAKTAISCASFVEADSFAVNILAEEQKDLSTIFASKRPEKFEHAAWQPGSTGSPVLDGVVSWFDCSTYSRVDAGDHILLLGKIVDFAHSASEPLGYVRGSYFTPTLERDALSAASREGATVVGGLIEVDSKIVLLRDPRTDTYHLPEAVGGSASISGLLGLLAAQGLRATISFVFAVYEEDMEDRQYIYYRGSAEGHPTSGDCLCLEAQEVPWQALRDPTTAKMLRRYFAEQEDGSFGLFSGKGDSGRIEQLLSGRKISHYGDAIPAG
jgi:flavin reductase (DIM6/NTAB) family NADH-FMN oxidoreductase RutF